MRWEMCFLAFFLVVASIQIFPHISGRKYTKYLYMPLRAQHIQIIPLIDAQYGEVFSISDEMFFPCTKQNIA